MENSTKYRFYIQAYDDTQPRDIETYFNCHYQAMTGNNQTSVKTYYEEDYAEHHGTRLWLPKNPEDIAFSASDITLCLLFKSNKDYEVLEDEKRFLAYITGKRFEYHDTFRPNRYWQLTFVSEPETKGEILYGNRQYRWVGFKMRNWGGTFYTHSQIK